MKDQRKIDFKKHASPPASKKFMVKILIYVVLLGFILYLLSKSFDSQSTEVIEIDASEIRLEK